MKLQLLTSVGIDGTSFSKGASIDVETQLAVKLIDSKKAVGSKAKKKAKK